MIKVFISRNLTEVDFVKSLLAGYGFPMACAWPVLWVQDEDRAKALEIAAQFPCKLNHHRACFDHDDENDDDGGQFAS